MLQSSSIDLGLRHMLENGLALMKNEQPVSGHGEDVLLALVDLLHEARIGSEKVSAQSLVLAADEREAFDRYSLFFNSLNEVYGEELDGRIEETAKAFDAVREKVRCSDEIQTRAVELLEAFLTAIESESRLSSFPAPKTVVLA